MIPGWKSKVAGKAQGVEGADKLEFDKVTLWVLAGLMVVAVLLVIYMSPADSKHLAAGAADSGEKDDMTIRVFFGNSRLDSEGSGGKVFAVERRIPRTRAVARSALQELLRGPTAEETARDYYTSINPGVKIQRLAIENSIAKVDFNEQLQARVAGSCRVFAIRAQITQTLKQFPSVDDVIISINGRSRDILQP
jgi:hypothetical protein